MPPRLAKTLLTAAGLAAAVNYAPAVTAGPAQNISVAVYGDSPYGTTPTDFDQLNTLSMPFINSINIDPDVALVLHLGDIHAGKQYCTEDYDRQILELWQAFQDPLVYTPGDNEWADCHKKGEGGGTYNSDTGEIDYVLDDNGNPVNYAKGDPLANLALIRSIFFSHPGVALGGGHLRLQSQVRLYDRRQYPDDSNYVENVIWTEAGVVFVAVNVPGGSNNDSDAWFGTPTLSTQQTEEVAARTGAAIRWLDRAFASARSGRIKGVVIMTQADMWDLDGKPAAHLTGYEPIVFNIAANAKALGKPVLLFNGDSHGYRSDNPLLQQAPCVTESGATDAACSDDAWAQHPFYNVPNFHRVVVHGSTTPLEWLKLTIDATSNAPAGNDAFGPFSWARMIQP